MNYGEVRLTKIGDSVDFWTLFDEMSATEQVNNPVISNRVCLLDAFKEGILFSLKIEETDEMYRRGAKEDDIFARDRYGTPSFYLLPCIIVVRNYCVEWLWVHPRIRNQGFGRILVHLSKAESINKAIPGSESFWIKLGMLK